jgi:hypothetical protein
MRRPVEGLILAGGLATALTLVIAWPVILSPTTLAYGDEILGRHGDAYAAMQHFATGDAVTLYTQPLTDGLGRLFGRVLHPVLAFNLLVLLSFPLTAMATYAFARYLHGSHLAALVAGLVFAFAPIRLAHAAYHVDLVQTQWLPLFFLAVVALVDRVTVTRIAGVAVTWTLLALATDYGALVGLLLAPVVIGAFWIIRPDAGRNLRPLLLPTLVVAVSAGAVIALMAARGLGPFGIEAGRAHPIDDIGFFRARWWAFLTPPIGHPVLGRLSAVVFDRGGINVQMLEQQVFLGIGFLLLMLTGVVLAIAQWASRWRAVAAVAVVAVAAAGIAIAPMSGACDAAALAPGCLMYRVFPILRDYGRFAFAVSLMVAVGAGAGAALLWQLGEVSRLTAIGLLAVGVAEFLPLPARAHPVLPSAAHRWLASQKRSEGRILDCFPNDGSESQLPWLTGQPLSFLDNSFATCNEPEIVSRLQTLGYSQVLVRKRTIASPLPQPLPEGLSVAREFDDATLYDVSGTRAPIVTLSATGFYPFEHDGPKYWRWMGATGAWQVRNTTAAPVPAAVEVELEPMGLPRTLTVRLGDQVVARITAEMGRRAYRIGPMTLPPGDHTIALEADGPALRPSDVDTSRDRRLLTLAFHNERWVTR